MSWLVQVERCCLVSKNGVTLELPPRSDRTQEVRFTTRWYRTCMSVRTMHAACNALATCWDRMDITPGEIGA